MTVVRVNSFSNQAYSISRAGSPLSVRSPVQRVLPVERVSPIGNKAGPISGLRAAHGDKAGRAAGRSANIFFNYDGDSAEISDKATKLFRQLSDGNSAH